jgi:hypothetical protein
MLIGLAAATAWIAVTPGPATAAPKSQRDELREAATGTWSGEFGTLEFGADRTATFAVRLCGYSPVRPGFVETFTDCDPDVVTGRLLVRRNGYALEQPDESAYEYAAYVDGDTLYLGAGIVAPLDADRRGTVEIGPGEKLKVGDGRCKHIASFGDEVIDRPCRFERRKGRTVLIYVAPNPFSGGKVERNGLVYLPDLGLLVSPELIERPYTPSST